MASGQCARRNDTVGQHAGMGSASRAAPTAVGSTRALRAHVDFAAAAIAQTVPLNLPGREQILSMAFGHLEPGLYEAILVVAAIIPHMVKMTIHTLALRGINDRGILKGLLDQDWNVEDRESRRPQHAAQLAHRLPVVGNVLEHVGAVDHIETVVGMTDIGDVHLLHRRWIVQIRAEIAAPARSREDFPQRLLGCDMQKTLWLAVEEIGCVQKYKEQTMTFERATRRASRIGARLDAILEKSVRSSIADSTISTHKTTVEDCSIARGQRPPIAARV